MAEEARSRLGRGLAALIGDVGEEAQTVERIRTPRRVPIEFLRANPRNPRREFSDEELDGLAASIKERGVIQPIVVRPVAGKPDAFEIIAGERRWRASQRAGLHDVPIIPLEVSDREALELAIIENVQRADLNPVEEANGYAKLIEEYGHSQEDLAKIVGKSRSHVANTLRLLKLSVQVQRYITTGQLTAGHARMLVGQPNAEEIAQEIIERGLNVRQVEAWAREDGKAQARAVHAEGRAPKASPGKDPDTVALERRVSDALGLKVVLDHKGGSGVLHIHFSDLEQLEEVLRRLEKR